MSIVSELYHRSRTLSFFGLMCLLGAGAALAIQVVDHRLIEGVNAWVKPTKFFISIAVFSLSSAWFIGDVVRARRAGPSILFVTWATVIASVFELYWIIWQAAHGQKSHFNTSSSIAIIMYGLMGVGAVTLILTLLPLAHAIHKSTEVRLRPDYKAAVVWGLVLSCGLGGGFGAYMSAQSGHFVGAVGGQMPLFGWNRIGGDLRVAHFFGSHIEQVLPFTASMVASLPQSLRWMILLISGLVLIVAAVALFAQALMGQPFWPSLTS